VWEYIKNHRCGLGVLKASKVIKIAQHEKTRHKYFLHGYWYWEGLKLLIKINTKELKMACNDAISKLLKLNKHKIRLNSSKNELWYNQNEY